MWVQRAVLSFSDQTPKAAFHPQTLNILRRLKDYLQTLELILSLFPNPFKTSDPTLDPQTKTRIVAALADPNPQETVSSPRYFADILDALLTNIETKSRNYKKSSLQAVFLMNNYSYVLSALRTDLPNLAPGDYELRCEKGLAKWREVYLDGWKPVLEHLMDITYVSGGKVQGQLGRAQREVIKEKFKVGFPTKEMEINLTNNDPAELQHRIRNHACLLARPLGPGPHAPHRTVKGTSVPRFAHVRPILRQVPNHRILQEPGQVHPMGQGGG